MYKNNMEEQELTEQIQKQREFVASLDLEDMIERIVSAYESTDVILEGYNLVTNINEGHGIAIAGIIRLRKALEETLDWFKANMAEAEEIDIDEL